MKVWKMVASLVLLAVVICTCIVLGQNMEVAAEDATNVPPQNEQISDVPPTEADKNAPVEEDKSPDNVTSVEKTYSEGLAFRSNGDGTCAVAGIGSCTAACILIPPISPAGDTVTEILPYAFSGCIIGAIEIPRSVTTLSAASFAGVERLALIRIESENTAFCEYDGALYSADGKTLVYCPAGRISTELYLREELTRIAAGALSDCRTLRTVYYPGASAAWNALIIGDGNDILYAASLQFGVKSKA